VIFVKSATSVFRRRCSGTGYTTDYRAVRETIVLCIVCFAYSLYY